MMVMPSMLVSQPLEPQFTRPRVLIIENDSNVWFPLQNALDREYRLSFAKTGIDAIERLGQEAFDLILLDMTLPDMSGLDVLNRVRSMAASADVPVILIASRTHDQDVARGLQQGASDYVTKPLNMEITRARLKTQLALKKRLDEQQQTITNLTKRYEIKDHFLRIASHDLKNPLNNILLAHYQLRSVVGDDPDAAEALDTIEDTVHSMTDLVEDYLDSAALEHERPQLELDRVEIQEAIEEVVLRYGIAANRKGINLLIEETPGTVMADYGRLIQILSNLISNAIKFSLPDSTVRIASNCHENWVRIFVADEGPGIPSAERSDLFKPFSKLSPRPTGGESSIGLGLWIVKELTTLQNGRVDVECPDEGGSVFWFELPASD